MEKSKLRNRALGLLKENIDIFKTAILYLETDGSL